MGGWVGLGVGVREREKKKEREREGGKMNGRKINAKEARVK